MPPTLVGQRGLRPSQNCVWDAYSRMAVDGGAGRTVRTVSGGPGSEVLVCDCICVLLELVSVRYNVLREPCLSVTVKAEY